MALKNDLNSFKLWVQKYSGALTFPQSKQKGNKHTSPYPSGNALSIASGLQAFV